MSFLSNSLPLMRDEQWKRVHKIVSSVFSSGRIKEVCINTTNKTFICHCTYSIALVCFVFGQMFPIMLHHSANLIRNIYRMENRESVDIKKFETKFCLVNSNLIYEVGIMDVLVACITEEKCDCLDCVL